MSFGPELTPEEQQRRQTIVVRIGAVLLPAILAFVFFAAFGGLHAFLNIFATP